MTKNQAGNLHELIEYRDDGGSSCQKTTLSNGEQNPIGILEIFKSYKFYPKLETFVGF